MRGHRDLLAWQKAMDLTKEIYLLTERFPKHELYGVTAQLRRAAVSIPSNLAEGSARNSKKEFAYFISTARGSRSEVETQVGLAFVLGYISGETAETMSERIGVVGRLLTGFRNWFSFISRPADQQPATSNPKLK